MANKFDGKISDQSGGMEENIADVKMERPEKKRLNEEDSNDTNRDKKKKRVKSDCDDAKPKHLPPHEERKKRKEKLICSSFMLSLRDSCQEEQGMLLSPANDESSRQVFGLIKEPNIMPVARKKAQTSSFFDKMLTGGNNNSSSKSSFLGRAPSHSLLSSHKQGTSTVQSFIFGLDDSNSIQSQR